TEYPAGSGVGVEVVTRVGPAPRPPKLLSGQNRRMALARMRLRETSPKNRESHDALRLSPMTKYWPAGMWSTWSTASGVPATGNPGPCSQPWRYGSPTRSHRPARAGLPKKYEILLAIRKSPL